MIHFVRYHLVLLGFTLSVSAFGQGHAQSLGHPDEDVVVKNLRQAFTSEAVIPTADEVVGAWECLVHSAKRGRTSVDNDHFEISHVTNNIFSLGAASRLVRDSVFRLYSDGFSSTSDRNSLLTFRIIRSSGNLIGERSFMPAATTQENPPSISVPGFVSSYYYNCRK
jgi:hypothetical protein